MPFVPRNTLRLKRENESRLHPTIIHDMLEYVRTNPPQILYGDIPVDHAVYVFVHWLLYADSYKKIRRRHGEEVI